MPTPDEIELSGKVYAKIKEIAASLGIGNLLGLVFHRPEDWAMPSRCFENAAAKVRRDGGKMAYGWTFHKRHVEDIPEQVYVFITHHAVWHAPDGGLVNVTPYPEDTPVCRRRTGNSSRRWFWKQLTKPQCSPQF